MTTPTKTVEIKVQRTIPAPPSDVFDARLDPKVPGTLWHGHDKLILNPKVDGLWYLIRQSSSLVASSAPTLSNVDSPAAFARSHQ
jgi:hypothetical protein